MSTLTGAREAPGSGPMKEFRVTLRLHNNLLRQRREELGLSRKEFATTVGVSYGLYCDMEGLRYNPFSHGTWNRLALIVASYHGLPPEDLWPGSILAVEHTVAERTFDADEVGLLLSDYQSGLCLPPSEMVEDKQESEAVARVMSTLTPREERALRARFGFDGDEMTYREAGGVLGGVSAERARQIELKAFRKLNHPARLKRLGREAPIDYPDMAAKCECWKKVRTLRSWCMEREEESLQSHASTRKHEVLLYTKVTGGALAGDTNLFGPEGPYYRVARRFNTNKGG